MAHPDPNLSAIQTKLANKSKPPLNPADVKALTTQITTFSNAAIGRKLTYALQNGISLTLTDDEMASVLADINANAKGK